MPLGARHLRFQCDLCKHFWVLCVHWTYNSGSDNHTGRSDNHFSNYNHDDHSPKCNSIWNRREHTHDSLFCPDIHKDDNNSDIGPENNHFCPNHLIRDEHSHKNNDSFIFC